MLQIQITNQLKELSIKHNQIGVKQRNCINI